MVAAVRSLSDLRTEIRQRCDQENMQFVTDAEINSYVGGSACALHEIILDYAGSDAFLHEHLFSTVAGHALYAIPMAPASGGGGLVEPGAPRLPPEGAFYRLVGVDVRFGGRWTEIDRASMHERNRFEGRAGWSSRRDVRYMLAGRDPTGVPLIRFLPTPTAVFEARIWYQPLQPDISELADYVQFNGWSEFIVADVCAKIVEKEEGDSRPFITRRNEAAKRVMAACLALDSAKPLQMQDVSDECDVEWS